MKYLIVGLGNIGDEYENTRHNAGFTLIDAFAKTVNAVFAVDRYASVAHASFKGRQLVLIKPSTYMNLSGKAVSYWMQKEKIAIENVLVLVDDLALPFGSLRLKAKGSAGGHNGLKNIQELLGSENYPRLRFGVGNNFSKGQQVDFVLGEWTKEEKDMMPQITEKSNSAIQFFITQGVEKAMTFANQK
ncbi:MAG: aminoacyl-tRNA hydrolase [Bacteroidales bacterium]|nr:aminoacyl-tRNA hydrolase [Bacteroidales bacterium]